MRVLVADDEITTRRLLERSLEAWGYEVVSVADGSAAWEALQAENAPRLAVLDWMMPGLDGVELCARLRDRQDGALVYTILLTSRDQAKDMIEGLESGAHDFISKPFDAAELKSRMAVGVRIVDYENALAAKNAQLQVYASQMEGLAEERARQLVHADRMATLGVMSAGIAHEINNPTSFISGNVQTQRMFYPEIERALQERLERAEGEERQRLEFIVEELPRTLDAMTKGVGRITRIVKGLKAYARQDTGDREPCNINDCIDQALELCHNALKQCVEVTKNLAADLPLIVVSTQEMEQVFVNLFINAADALAGRGSGRLWVHTEKVGNSVVVIVEDNGPGIPEALAHEIWKPFFTTKEAGKGTGLGLAISHRIVEDHGGTIKLGRRDGGGTRFEIMLPIEQKAKTDPAPGMVGGFANGS